MADPLIFNLDSITYYTSASYIDNVDIKNKYTGDYYIRAQSYEGDNIYPTNYQLVDASTRDVVEDYISLDGSLLFNNLDNRKYNLVVFDSSNKYISKYIGNIQPVIDYNSALKIIKIYSDVNYMIIRVIFNVDIDKLSVYVNNSNTIENIDLGYYKITGNLSNLEITVDDYINNIPIRKVVKYN